MKIFIVDIGGSYKKLCENLNGQYVPIGVDKGLSLNPFDLAANETTPSSHKIKFLVGLVEMMSKEVGEKRIPKLERAELEDAIQAVYATKIPYLSDLRGQLLSHKDPTVQRYGKILGNMGGQHTLW